MSATPRPTPFELVFGSVASERFPAVRAGLAAADRDPSERDAFLLVREVAELLRELVPEAGMGAALQGMVTFLHHAYLFWLDGEQVRVIDEEVLERYCHAERSEAAEPVPFASLRVTAYVQLPALKVWGSPIEGQPVEPLDGWFVQRLPEQLAILAVFGVSPTRPGFSTVEVVGPRPAPLARPDGSALFAPTLAGGATAGLASLAGAEELLELAWRAEAAA